MVAVSHENIYRSAKRFEGRYDTDIIVFKFPSPLIYANQIRYCYKKKCLFFHPYPPVTRKRRWRYILNESSLA